MTRNLTIAAVLLLCAACQKAPEKPAAVAETPAPAAGPAVAPADQTALVARIDAANGDSATSAAFCAEFQKTATFTNWVVGINDVSTSTINASIDIVLDAGPHVRLEQVIQTSDPAYRAVEALRMGTKARISGRFTHGNGECGYQLRTINVAISKAETVG